MDCSQNTLQFSVQIPGEIHILTTVTFSIKHIARRVLLGFPCSLTNSGVSLRKISHCSRKYLEQTIPQEAHFTQIQLGLYSPTRLCGSHFHTSETFFISMEWSPLCSNLTLFSFFYSVVPILSDPYANIEQSKMTSPTDPRYFPSFDECPHELVPNFEFYAVERGNFLQPKRHWCLLAEIVDVEIFIRLRLWVKDRTENVFPISFYIEDDSRKLDLSRFQKGRTVAILHAEQHNFLDMTVGIRQESSRTIEVRRKILMCCAMLTYQVYDMPLNNILSLGKENYRSSIGQTERKCHVCGEGKTSLQKCSKCEIRWYCGKVSDLLMVIDEF